MSRRRIVYVGMYDYPDDVVNRFYSLAAINKMNYIISLLNENGKVGVKYKIFLPISTFFSLLNLKVDSFEFDKE